MSKEMKEMTMQLAELGSLVLEKRRLCKLSIKGNNYSSDIKNINREIDSHIKLLEEWDDEKAVKF